MATHFTISECTLTTESSEDILTDLRGLFGQHQGERESEAEGGGFVDLLQQGVGEDFQQGQEVMCRLIPADPQTATPSLTPSLEFSEHLIAGKQRKDANLVEIVHFLEQGILPADDRRARKIALQGPSFTIMDQILYYFDPKAKGHSTVVVPKQMQTKLLRETHSGPFGGHFSGQRLHSTLATHWWWEGMFCDALNFARSSPDCAIVTGTGRVN